MMTKTAEEVVRLLPKILEGRVLDTKFMLYLRKNFLQKVKAAEKGR